MKVNTLFFPDNDDDNDDIGDDDDCYCDDVGEDNDDIDDGSSCGQVELMQKGNADDEEPFHNDIGQSGDRHCREALLDRLCYRAEEDEEFDVSEGMYFGT